VYLLGVLLLLFGALLGLLVGSTHLSFSEIFASLSGAADTPSARIVRYVRLPRVGASLLCGAALAVAGAVIQRVLANPLASPSIIGVNAGAGLAVTVCAACGVVGGFRVSLFAFLGAFLCVLLVSLGAKRFGASRSTVVLMGVAINSLLGAISDFTNSIGWGFNFLWASLAAMLIKVVVKQLHRHNLMHRVYINNYQMDRISGFSFDLMIVAGVSAIEINDIRSYILPVVVLSVVGAVITYVYIRKVSKECFKGFEHEMFLMAFGTLTGTASNGMILMKEVDPGLRTPTSSLYILSNFPGMVMIAPLLLLLGFAGKTLTNAIIACAIFFVLWAAYTIFLFRRRIFKKRYANKPVIPWEEEAQS
jgi:ABC-type cobalamin transport system permease subunit